MIRVVTEKATWPFLLVAFLIFPLPLFAVGGATAFSGADTQSTSEQKKESVTATGCLERAAAEGLLVLNCEDGTMYVLKSKDVDLQAHTGHKVTVTGVLTEIDDEEEGSEEYREGGVMMLVVTKLQMVSAKCR
jgi:hypothetical protein